MTPFPHSMMLTLSIPVGLHRRCPLEQIRAYLRSQPWWPTVPYGLDRWSYDHESGALVVELPVPFPGLPKGEA